MITATQAGRPVVLLAALAAVLTACSGNGGASASPTGDGAEATPGAGEFANPVFDRDFPDPGILAVDGTYYAYATTNGSFNLQVASSEDLVNWEHLGEALPRLPLWSSGDTWAPEVAETSAGFVMTYTARYPQLERPDGQGSQCISMAVAESPEGPFVDESDEPIVCQPDLGGSIDSTFFTDTDGTFYLVWKNDGNCCGLPTEFWAQELAPDGLSLVGDVTNLGVRNDARWEGAVIEAPTVHVEDGTYYLFYSGNSYAGVQYAVGYATADNVLGPYQDAEENPILAKPEERGVEPFGPGHQSIVADKDGDLWMLYHAWESNFRQRYLWIDELVFEDGAPVIIGPDAGPQPVP